MTVASLVYIHLAEHEDQLNALRGIDLGCYSIAIRDKTVPEGSYSLSWRIFEDDHDMFVQFSLRNPQENNRVVKTFERYNAAEWFSSAEISRWIEENSLNNGRLEAALRDDFFPNAASTVKLKVLIDAYHELKLGKFMDEMEKIFHISDRAELFEALYMELANAFRNLPLKHRIDQDLVHS